MVYKLISVLCTIGLTLSLCKAQTSGDSISASTKVKLPGKYQEIITSKAQVQSGFFKVFKLEDRFYFQISNNFLDKDILVVNRIVQAATESRNPKFMMGFAGDQIGECVIRFVRGPGYRIFLKKVSFSEISRDSSENGLYNLVRRSNFQPIVAAFDIKTFAPDSSIVIDMTEYFRGDNDVFFFGGSSIKSIFSLGAYQPDKSYVEDVKAFSTNIEIKTVKTYQTPLARISFKTMELNSSMVLLPEKELRIRAGDSRVGIFFDWVTDFDGNPQAINTRKMMLRWRLEPKKGEQASYLRGELVEPEKPIVYYIDPNTPKKWIPYLIQGVNDWQRAFEQAGFKNAIYAREVPIDDSSFSIEDSKHNIIIYKPADIENASGPNITDPRTGEILESHVNWYHNVMKLLHDWYMVQAAPVDSSARKMEFSDSLMGRLIRYVCTHEIGHTLGLAHNFGASSTVPVDSLRSKTFIARHGISPSIMDYSRFNYVAQPQDKLTQEELMPRIGEYDKWAIEWAYRWRKPFSSADEERTFYNRMVIDSLERNKFLWWGFEGAILDPRCQAEDLGDDAMKAGTYGIENLKNFVNHLTEWAKIPNENSNSIIHMYNEILDQYTRYLFHVCRNIGGVMSNFKTVEQLGSLGGFVDKIKQKNAVSFLHREVFTTPNWLYNSRIFENTLQMTAYSINLIQGKVLDKLLEITPLSMMTLQQYLYPDKAYTVDELLSDLEIGIFSELSVKKPIEIQRRNLQKIYVDKLISFIYNDGKPLTYNYSDLKFNSDIVAIIRGHLKKLQKQIKLSELSFNGIDKLHLQDINYRIQQYFAPITGR